MRKKQYFVYMLASKKNGVIYIGVTNDLVQRVENHKNGLASGFTRQYKVYKLVYYEQYEHVQDAIHREKRMKKWRRQWKIELIEKFNPEWKDLYEEIRTVQG